MRADGVLQIFSSLSLCLYSYICMVWRASWKEMLLRENSNFMWKEDSTPSQTLLLIFLSFSQKYIFNIPRASWIFHIFCLLLIPQRTFNFNDYYSIKCVFYNTSLLIAQDVNNCCKQFWNYSVLNMLTMFFFLLLLLTLYVTITVKSTFQEKFR